MKSLNVLIIIFVLITPLFADDRVRLTFAGDLMAHDVNYRTEPLTDIYKGVSDLLLNDDLSFVNLEFPIDETRKQSSYPSFNVHPKYVEAAIISGFDVFSLGNNHTNDFGYDSLMKTAQNMDIFKKKHLITYSGLYQKDETEFVVETIQVKSLTIGFISITQFSNNYWNKQGAKKVYTIDYKNSEKSKELLKFVSEIEGDYDCLIMSYHGGLEYKADPSELRKQFFKDLTNVGVDILWAHHPHVLQSWNQFSTDSGDKLIMHSMGNFISGQLAIVDPVDNNINFAATGFSSLFKTEIIVEDGKLKILKASPKMIANIRNENNYFVTVDKEVALNYPMSEDWKNFYKKMFPIAEYRIRKD